MEKIPMTRKGQTLLEQELKHLRSEERPAVIRAIAEAREHGDLSENAEYHAARERQSFIEGRISELEDVIGRADVIDVSKMSGDVIRFGAMVTLADEDTDEEVTYHIVGPYEADLKNGRISIQSPIAKALVGKSEGDTVEVTAPGGSRSYEVITVKFADL
jgi:transcription elongation factor GreA